MKELIYPSTYHAMKAGPCRIGVCKRNGEYRLLVMKARDVVKAEGGER